MNFFTKKTESIRKTIEGVQLLAVSYYSVSYSSPQKLIQCFITIGQKELNKMNEWMNEWMKLNQQHAWYGNSIPTKLM